MKRIISIILAMSMLLSLLGGVPIVFAETAERVVYNLLGDGTENSAPKNTDLWSVENYTFGDYSTNFTYLDASPEIDTLISGGKVANTNGTMFDISESGFNARLLRHASSYFRFMTANGDYVLPDGQWFAMKLKTDEIKGFDCNATIDVKDGNGIKYSVYLAPYEEGKNDGSPMLPTVVLPKYSEHPTLYMLEQCRTTCRPIIF